MKQNIEIQFDGKSFCFTGLLSDMERSDAEIEVRKRGGFISKGVNSKLNYLIIGSIPNPDWKFGNYGNKINSAILQSKKNGNPILIYENDFLKSLSFKSATEVTKTEDLLMLKFHFYSSDNNIVVYTQETDQVISVLARRFKLFIIKEETAAFWRMSSEIQYSTTYKLVTVGANQNELITNAASALFSTLIFGDFTQSIYTAGTALYMNYYSIMDGRKTA